MKKMMILFVALFLSAGLFAQNDKDKKTDKKMDKMDKMHDMKDCIMNKGGKIIEMKDGKTMDLDKDVTLSNGTVVMKDGNVKMKDGKTAMLKDGECIYMNGKIKKMGKM